jgi:hypothetical protein
MMTVNGLVVVSRAIQILQKMMMMMMMMMMMRKSKMHVHPPHVAEQILTCKRHQYSVQMNSIHVLKIEFITSLNMVPIILTFSKREIFMFTHHSRSIIIHFGCIIIRDE